VLLKALGGQNMVIQGPPNGQVSNHHQSHRRSS
jgi:hypothetical protein